jgi:hypothetical protein
VISEKKRVESILLRVVTSSNEGGAAVAVTVRGNGLQPKSNRPFERLNPWMPGAEFHSRTFHQLLPRRFALDLRRIIEAQRELVNAQEI